MTKLILVIDQGTTGTGISLLDSQAQLIAQADHEFEQIFPQPGWVEHDLGSIWRTVEKGIQEVLQKSGQSAKQIVAIGITNQRETVGLWNRKSGQPLMNAIVWQCRRTTPMTEKLKSRQGIPQKVRKTTGLVLDPYFSATKIKWMLDKAALKGKTEDICAGTIDSYLIFKLTKGQTFATDVTNASRTSLMSLKTLSWDKSMCKLFQVPAQILPEILPSTGPFGVTKGLLFLPDGIPITGVIGDQQSALFGQGCFDIGQAKCTFGTGSFILMNTGNRPVFSKSKMLTTVAWKIQNQKPVFAIEGGAFICGAAVQWLRDQLGFVKHSSEIESLALKAANNGGVHFVPALAGLGAPHWDPDARGLLMGLTRATNRAHIARAVLEGMAFQNMDIVNVMKKDLSKPLKNLRVDGGASQNNLLMQIQADVLGVQIDRPLNIETTTMGAAFMAGLGVGLWPSLKDVISLWKAERSFHSAWTISQRNAALKSWNQAVARSKSKGSATS